MFPEVDYYLTYMRTLRDRLRILREDDRGMTTETVIITAALVLAAVTLTGIITDRITREQEHIGP